MKKAKLFKGIKGKKIWGIKSNFGAKIGNKIGACLVSLLLIMILMNTYIISNFARVGQLNEDLTNGPYTAVSQAIFIERELESINKDVSDAIFRANEDNHTQILQRFDDIQESIDIIRETQYGNSALIFEFQNAMSKLMQHYRRINPYIYERDIEVATQLTEVGSEYYSEYEKAREIMQDIYDDAYSKVDEADANVKRIISQSSVTSIILSVLSIIVGVIICLYIVKMIKKPIEEIETAANKMAQGEYEFSIDYESKDELGQLAESMRQVCDNTKEAITDMVIMLSEISSGNFNVETNIEYQGVFKSIERTLNKITDDLSETIHQVDIASQEVELAAVQGASRSQILAQGATEQATAIEELSSTILEVSGKIQDTANHARQANSLTKASSQEVKEGNEQMKLMVNAMQEISSTSSEISRIIKTIDDIAFQTNILALNAAVEAARAGVAGKGFAVVADEVRNLAAKSAEAAQNTATLIENSIKAVDNGNIIVENTASSLQRIIDTTNQTEILVNEIAKASEEESIAIDQIRLGINQISDVVQTTSATSEESAAGSEELSAQAHTLKELIERFEIKK